MSRPPLSTALLWLVLAAFAASPLTATDQAENYRQLQAMPRERRLALSENLERFDRLDPAEQASIRSLDAELARLDPVVQARYRSLLRRYHLWANGLTDVQKTRLNEAGGPEDRFNLARKYRLQQLQGGASGPRVFGIRTGDFGLLGPYEAAHLLRIWNRLTGEQKLVIGKEQERGRLHAEIRAHQKSLGTPPPSLAPSEEEPFLVRLEGNEDFRKSVGLVPRHGPASKKGAPASKRPDPRYAEFLHFEEHKPKPVAQKDLERFSESCPDWLHAMLDSLSADDARAYLTILYRILNPETTEMPVNLKSSKSTAPTSSAPAKASPRKSGAAGPF